MNNMKLLKTEFRNDLFWNDFYVSRAPKDESCKDFCVRLAN